MADYIARYSKGPDLPVVTYNGDGEALVYTPYGTLAVANKIEGFKAVEPYKQTWHIGPNALGLPGSITKE